MKDGFVETNGIRLHYLDHAGEGLTLVLLPGLTANAHSFGGLVRAGLTNVGHVLALDMRGRGESDAPATGYAIEDHGGDVLGLLVKSMPYFAEGGWDDDVEQYFRADVRVRPDGTVQARCRPAHIEEVIQGEFLVDWPRLAAGITQPTLLLRAPGSFGPPGAPPLLSREAADRTAAAMADCRVVDGIGNHLTFVFGPGAQVLTRAIAEFLAEARS